MPTPTCAIRGCRLGDSLDSLVTGAAEEHGPTIAADFLGRCRKVIARFDQVVVDAPLTKHTIRLRPEARYS